jgi:hypothetical protein
MTPRDPERELDELLGEDGGRVGNLYRRLPRYEPPRRLDRAVLGEAARAVHSGRPPRRQRWIVGVGSAAGLVLAAGIAWRIGHEPISQDVPASSAPRVVPVEPISESARAKREEAPQQSAADASNAAQPDSENSPTRAAQGELKQEPHKARASSKPAPPALAAPKPAPAPAASAPPAPFPAEERDREQATDLQQSAAAGRAPAAQTAGTMAPAFEKKVEAPGERGLASPTPPSGSVELRRDMQLAPEDWLAHIHQLQRQGRRQQATESLRLFQRAHPDWTIPDDLRPLLH